MKSIDTRCVHAGYHPGKGEPRQLPIVQSTTFKYDTSEQMARLFDLEDIIEDLEQALGKATEEAGFSFADNKADATEEEGFSSANNKADATENPSFSVA